MFLFLVVVLVVGTAVPTLYASNVPFKLGDLMNEDGPQVSSLWEPYYSPEKRFSINYYDAHSLFSGQNITEHDSKIRLDTLPMYISVTLKGPFYRTLTCNYMLFKL